MVLGNAFWIILTGSLVAASCALLGCFLVLRKISMLGDAISHAILPGIVFAFLLTNSRASLYMFLGAAVIGVLTALIVETLSKGGVQGDASIGVTFTSLFALGVVLVSLYGSHIDLDLDCVLYGEIAYAPFDLFLWGEKSLGPRPVWTSGILLALNLVVVGLFFKEFKICAFDPDLALALGLPVALLHYLLMGLVSVTAVGAFESVGAILVVAMLIVPPATAYLLTDRLGVMMILAVVLGVISSFTGYFFASWLDVSIAGAMASCCGGFFALAFLFSPRQGVVTKALQQRQVRKRIALEDMLLWAGRRLETEPATGFSSQYLSQDRGWLVVKTKAILNRLKRSGLISQEGDSYSLTTEGQKQAVDLLRRHRLYESYLDQLGYPTDHVHDPADRVEHYISDDLTRQVSLETNSPELDPQGKPIPKGGMIDRE